jgi:neutral ceramidase
MFLLGYPHVARISTGIHDPIFASALCMQNESEGILFVAVDVLMLSSGTVDQCRARISQATGIPPQNILISATHTHSAPVAVELLAFRDDPVVPPIDPGYLDVVCQGIVDAATEAHARAVYARAAVTTASAVGVGGNRHSVHGPSDPEVGVLYLQARQTGEPIALGIVYSMHPTVLHEDSTWVSSDFPGYAREYVARHLPGVTVLYHTGPSGNQSPRHYVTGQTFGEAERLGHQLGAAVLDAIRRLQKADWREQLTLAAARSFVELPVRHLPSVVQAEAMLQEAVLEYDRLKSLRAPRAAVRTAECAVFGAEEQVTLARAQQRGEIDALRERYRAIEVQVLRAGEAFFVGWPGECFVEYGLELKRQTPRHTFVISLANGELQGYIVTPEATGYEASFGLFAPQAGSIMVDAAARLVTRLAAQEAQMPAE